MSNYASTFASAVVATGPAFYYPMDEAVAPGDGNPPSLFNDRMNHHNLNLEHTGSGDFTRGVASLLPGDPAGACLRQDRELPIASRANNAFYDASGGIFTQLTMMCVFQIDRIKSTQQRLISKYNSYTLYIDKTAVVAGISGQSNQTSSNDIVVPGNTLMVVSIFDSPNAKQELWINGGLVTSRTIATNLTVPSNSNPFRVGGYTDSGSFGVSAAVQHVAVWQVGFGINGTPPTTTNIRNFYELGVTDEAEQLGEALNVMPWSRQAFGANPDRKYIILSNDSDVEIYVALSGSNALAAAGLRIPPNEWRKLDGYKGAGSAIHKTGMFGAKRLTIAEVEE